MPFLTACGIDGSGSRGDAKLPRKHRLRAVPGNKNNAKAGGTQKKCPAATACAGDKLGAIIRASPLGLPIGKSYIMATRWKQMLTPCSETGELAMSEQTSITPVTPSLDEAIFTHWQHQLTGSLPGPPLQTDYVRRSRATWHGGVYDFSLPTSLARDLASLAGRLNVRLNTILLAAFQCVLFRYSNQEEVVLGLATGDAERWLPLRTNFADDPTFPALVERVWQNAGAAQRQPPFLFAELVARLGITTDAAVHPIFQVSFGFESLTARKHTPHHEKNAPWLDLALWMRPDQGGAGGLHGEWEYNTELFTTATIARITGHFLTLLAGVTTQPENKVSALPLLTENERQQILVEWTSETADFARDRCMQQIFEEWAYRAPDALAVHASDEEVTFDQLNRRANQLAHHLVELGVGPEKIVALCADRSIAFHVGMIAVLKAGGAYLPVDPELPQERMAFMLEDVQAPVVLTRRKFVDRLPPTSLPVVVLDEEHPVFANQSESNPDPRNHSRNLAYVIFTSGSTGQPKGVAIEHQSVANLITFYHRRYGICPGYRGTQVARPSFDASVSEMWCSLGNGAAVFIPDQDTYLSPPRLIQYVAKNQITHMDLSTPLAEAMLEETWPTPLAMKYLFTGGDKLRKRPPRDLPFPLIDQYGPTENTVISTECPVDPEGVGDDNRQPHIGRPLCNEEALVLDAHLNLVPIGVPGELHLGGVGLARGYLNRPELTAEKFIPHPLRADPTARLYKTGDLARFLPDGNIQFLGRIDFQVKIRGFRIELGDIEAALGQHPAVDAAVVLAHEDQSGQKFLAAYVIPKEHSTPPDPVALRAFVRERLPEYMVPQVVLVLPEFPLTPNKKVDRRALPVPTLVTAEADRPYAAPRNPMETVLAAVFAEVLKLPRVGIDDNFFELGGHSLKATQVISRISKQLDADLPLQAFFTAPTVAALAEILTARDHQAARETPIVPLSGPRDRFPASFAQQRLWLVTQLNPDEVVYNIATLLRLRGPVNPRLVQRVLTSLAARHEGLRTIFEAGDGQGVQVIQQPGLVELPVMDLSGEADPDAAAQKITDDEARKGFDLTQGPLHRALLLRLREHDYILAWNMDHIITDGWSIGVLIREFSDTYAELARTAREGEYQESDTKKFPTNLAEWCTSPLPTLPIQYADYAAWHREWLQGSILEKQRAYWRQALRGTLPTLDLPMDRPRPSLQTYAGARRYLQVNKDVVEKLKVLSNHEGASLFMTLLAIFKTLLYRYSGQTDVIIGSPIANRNCPETENLVGFFVNMLPLRTDLAGDPTFRQLLARVRDVCFGAFAHQDLPFSHIVEDLPRNRDLARHPIYQIMFVFQNLPLEIHSFAGISMEYSEVDTGAARVDLTLELEENASGLSGWFEYNTDLFDTDTIDCLAEHWLTLLTAIAAHPGERISRLPLVTPAEEQKLLVDWNRTNADYARGRCLHQLIEEQVSRTPDAIAVQARGQTLTFGELNRRANQLAHYLVKQGVTPNALVGILLERTVELLVGLLGILKAGAAYVPLDPMYPKDRIAFMLEDAQAPVLITQRSLVDQVECTAQRVLVDDEHEKISELPEYNPGIILDAESRVYVIFTSGSTGKPKGVQIPHRALINFLQSMERTPGLTSQDILMAVTTVSFDIHALELWLPLRIGARIELVPREAVTDGQALLNLLQKSKSTVLQATPATWRLLLEAGWGKTPTLRCFIGGEALPLELANQLVERCGEVWNLYGPTETTVWSTVSQVTTKDQPIRIGRPIDNTEIYILTIPPEDERKITPAPFQALPLTPVRVAGELFIGGDGLALGYLNRPELTAEKFVPHPHADRTPLPPYSCGPRRVYRTGDLARWLPDGTIDFLGRVDYQVKIRGFRIELGEIETVLGKHPAIKSAVVMARTGADGIPYLAAYIIAVETAPSVKELRDHLRGAVPDYMVPARFVFLDVYPLTPNGKIDRKALPEPDASTEVVTKEWIPPNDPLELQLTTIWQEVLNVPRVGMSDNFFELGGHSLLAARLFTRMNRVFSTNLPLAVLFEAPTPADVAEVLRAGEFGAQWPCLVKVQTGAPPSVGAALAPLFCIPGIWGHVLNFGGLATALGAGETVYGLQARGLDGVQEPFTSVEEMAHQYIREIQAVQPRGPYYLLGYCVGGTVVYEMAQQLRSQGENVALLGMLEAWAPGFPPMRSWFGRIVEHCKRLWSLPAHQRADYLRARLRGLRNKWSKVKGQPDRADLAEHVRADAIDVLHTPIMEKVFFAFRQAEEKYQIRRYAGSMALFRAAIKPDWPSAILDDETLGWQKWVDQPVDVYTVNGEHLHILESEVQDLARQLTSCLAKVRAAQS